MASGLANHLSTRDDAGARRGDGASRRRLLVLAAAGVAGASLAGLATARLALAGSDDDVNGHDNSGHGGNGGNGGNGGDDDSGRGRGRGRGRGGRDGGDDAEADEAAVPVQIPGGSALVEIFDDDGYTPPTLTIEAGQMVTFVNHDGDDHTATGSGFDTGIIPEGGGTASVVLEAPGRYPFACLIHPEMTGEILVRDESGSVPERAAAAPAPADAVPVRIVNLAFAPASVSVPAGGAVVWTNDDSLPHTATALDGSFDSGILDPGGTFSWTFEAPGTIAYQCALHPQMQGEIVVTDEAAAAGSPEAATPAATPTAAGTPATTPTGGARVAIVDLAFEPAAITIPAGAEVVWTNTGQLPHTVTGDAFSSDVLESGQEFRHTFDAAGTFDYICAIHPQMQGQVIVEPA